MNPLPLSEIAVRCGAVLELRRGADVCVTRIAQDTRSLQPGDVYLALRGKRYDGHQFVADASRLGAAGAIVERSAKVSAPAAFPLLLVDDSLAALHRLAASWRAGLSLRAVGLTGSSGKTTTKEMIAAVLARVGRVTATRGNLNNHIGVPLSILDACYEDDFAVWEMGMNHAGEIRPLAELARPDIGVVTNIGTAHIEFLGSREAIANEKAELFRAMSSAGCCVYPGADDFADTLKTAAGSRPCFPVFFEHGDPHAENVRTDGRGTSFDLVIGGKSFPVDLNIAGRHMVMNALLAARVGMCLGVPPAEIAAGLSSAQTVGGRMRRLVIGRLNILDDTYNANPDSMEAALHALAEIPVSSGARRIAVLGEMGELGAHAGEGYARVGKTSAACVHVLITVGVDAAPMGLAARKAGLRDVFSVEHTREAATLIRSIARAGDLVLLKGSRSARMEQILPLLEPSSAQ